MLQLERSGRRSGLPRRRLSRNVGRAYDTTRRGVRMKIVYGKHRRRLQFNREGNMFIAPRGGYTMMAVEHDDGDITWGMAVCSVNDNFCKRTGRNIAVGRALQAKAHGKPASLPPGLYEHIYKLNLPEWIQQRVYGESVCL